MTRAEKVAEAQRLRAEGMTYRAIGERMGVPLKTAASWCLDPLLSKQRTRRERYAGTCEVCGGQMDGSRGYADQQSGRVCVSCLTWTETAVIDAMRRWADEHGGVPPTTLDWRVAHDGYPQASCAVIRHVGWNNLLLRAGFGLHCDRRPDTTDWIIEQIGAGVPTSEIADRLGCTTANIHERVSNRGLKVAELRRAAGLHPRLQGVA